LGVVCGPIGGRADERAAAWLDQRPSAINQHVNSSIFLFELAEQRGKPS